MLEDVLVRLDSQEADAVLELVLDRPELVLLRQLADEGTIV